jgi:hypothetical protein
MGYKEFEKQKEIGKEKPILVISELIGEALEYGDLADFVNETKRHLKASFNSPLSNSIDDGIKEKLMSLLNIYTEQVENKQKWLTTMGIIERKIIQYRYYRNTHVAISTQAQKSGDNTYNYILLRSPFMDAITGKKEIRIYFNKLEDYPSFKTIEDLCKDNKFYQDAIFAIRNEMESIMLSDGIDLKKLVTGFEQSESIQEIIDAKSKRYNEEILSLQQTISTLVIENLELKKQVKGI